ncbi:MAG: GTP cyclohydrolase I FolE2 [Ignavibacteria bacterium]|nr:GTP cyclohydrolase I FolE2 [Ignavibacteria bacterium]
MFEPKTNSKNIKTILPDTQNKKDNRKTSINKVGVRNLKYPIVLKEKEADTQHTIATISMTVDLPKHFKGTHMSRFLEIIESKGNEIHVNSLYEILEEMQKKLNANAAHIEMEFPYFKTKSAPVSKKKSLLDYTVRFHGVMYSDKKDFIMTVKIPVTTLCPCSKSISSFGAHNQRGEVTVSIRFKDMVWIEDIIQVVESSASSELFALLKRDDEKYVTEKAYENPVFVEDLVRNVVVKLRKNKSITWYTVEAENFESIHNHNAYAMIESDSKFNNGNEKYFIIKRYR